MTIFRQRCSAGKLADTPESTYSELEASAYSSGVNTSVKISSPNDVNLMVDGCSSSDYDHLQRCLCGSSFGNHNAVKLGKCSSVVDLGYHLANESDYEIPFLETKNISPPIPETRYAERSMDELFDSSDYQLFDS